ncbi:MAG: DUF1847 domain-containing protein [Proteobacteria bacterium]|nr:DUF1847 domain-containing protein [Pseudomonadota bacterium]MBU1737798.1 DUF1847 domain-containing protein [Pseudomonadota bacterium]
MDCAQCRQKPRNRCNSQGFDCTGGKLDLSGYEGEENRDFQNVSDLLRKIHGNSLCRLEEIAMFAKEAGYEKLGLAFCVSLREEAALVAAYLKKSFKVESAICKIAGIDKDQYGMIRMKEEGLEVACNPIGQAGIMNRAGTDLNIQLGLCIGHDILFQKYSDAPVTVLAVKDRVLANNPLGALYGSFWRKKLGITPDGKSQK